MAAVQMYFQQGRELATRRKEMYQQLLEKQAQLSVIEEVDTSEDEFLEFDTLLRRDWFENDDDIVDLVWDASQEVFQMIMNSSHTYPKRVQTVLVNTFARPTISSTVTMSIKNISDNDLIQMESTQLKELNKKIDEVWQVYKKENGLTRPENEVDDKYTELYETLQEKKKARNDKTVKKYVAPSMRGKVDSIDTEIQQLENEIVLIEQQVKVEDQLWENGKKSELYDKLLLTLL